MRFSIIELLLVLASFGPFAIMLIRTVRDFRLLSKTNFGIGWMTVRLVSSAIMAMIGAVVIAIVFARGTAPPPEPTPLSIVFLVSMITMGIMLFLGDMMMSSGVLGKYAGFLPSISGALGITIVLTIALSPFVRQPSIRYEVTEVSWCNYTLAVSVSGFAATSTETAYWLDSEVFDASGRLIYDFPTIDRPPATGEFAGEFNVQTERHMPIKPGEGAYYVHKIYAAPEGGAPFLLALELAPVQISCEDQ